VAPTTTAAVAPTTHDISDHVMRAAALHLVKAVKGCWEPHPDGCVQADVLALDDVGVQIVFWRGRGMFKELVVLAVLPRETMTLAELRDRPLAAWDVVPPGHSETLASPCGTLASSPWLDVRLIAPRDLVKVLQMHVHRVLSARLRARL
jgi:hypothetical protein